MTELEKYYNKFNEDKRLTRRHGKVEYVTTMHYIHKFLEKMDSPKIIDIGAGTGRYSVALADEGYDVTAVELVKYNLGILKSKKSQVKAFYGNAMDLSHFSDESFDMALVLGPLYHLFEFEDKVRVLKEAKRVTKQNGVIAVAYCMNEYSVLTYAFKENHIMECMNDGRLDEDFHTHSEKQDLYDYVRVEDIERLRDAAGLKSIKFISADGPANYIRQVLNKMDEDAFSMFIKYHLATCERKDLIGAGAHTVDFLKVPK